MTSLFLYLHDNLQITPLDEDQVKVTVTLPSDLVHHYVQVLDTLTGFAQTINGKVRLAKYQAVAETVNLGAIERDRYYQRIVEAYDFYTSQGLKRTAAIKQISSDLRQEKHPWSSVDLIRPSLVAAGRPGRQS